MEQKNIEVQRKKGLNLMMKILITAIIPLIILVAFAGLAIRAVGVTVSDKLMQHELKTSVYAVNQTMSILSSGDWNTDGDQHCESGRQPRDRDGDSSRCVSGCERKG